MKDENNSGTEYADSFRGLLDQKPITLEKRELSRLIDLLGHSMNNHEGATQDSQEEVYWQGNKDMIRKVFVIVFGEGAGGNVPNSLTLKMRKNSHG